MFSLEVIAKRGGEISQILMNEISLKGASVVRIGLSKDQIKGMRRVGDDLVITAVSGEVVIVHGFFTSFDGNKSDLVLNDDRGGLELAKLGEGQGDLAVDYSDIDSIEPLLLHQDFNFGLLPWLVGGGLAAAGAAGGGGGGNDAGAGSGASLPASRPTSPDDATPPGRPTINPTNAISITGTAEPGTVIRVTDSAGKEIGSATVAPDGTYEVRPAAPPPHGTELLVVAVDRAGNVSPEARATVDSMPPRMPTVDPTAGSLITGTAEPGSVVTVTDERGNLIGSTITSQDGTYRVTPATPPADGAVIHVVTTDVAGNASPSATATVDSSAPTGPSVHPTDGTTITGTTEPGARVTIKDGAGDIIGSATAGSDGAYSVTPAKRPADGEAISVVATDPAGNTSLPTIIKVDSTAPDAPTINPTDGSPITGTAEPGSVITATDANGAVIGSATTAASGIYNFTPAKRPANGEVIKVVAADAAGNVSAPATATIDGTPPTPTVRPTNGSLIAGTSEPDSMVTITDGNGSLIGSVVTAANGTYALAPATPPADGTVIQIVAKDPAGNVGRPVTTTVDSRPPDAPVVNATNGNSVTGISEADSVVTIKDGSGKLIGSTTADASGKFSITPAAPLANGTTLRVAATDAVGNTSAEAAATVDNVPPPAPKVDPTHGNPITGTAEAGSVVTIKDDAGKLIGSAVTAPDGTYRVTPTNSPANGTVLRVAATDAAGNTGPETSETVDGVPPARPTIDATNGSLIKGTAEPGSVVTIKDDSGKLLGSTTASPSTGAYSVAPATPPAHGTVLRATATDPAGNTSPEAKTTVDSAPPPAPTVDATNGNAITGTAEAGSVVTIKDNAGNLIGSTTADANGKFGINPSARPAGGTQISVVAVDAAGNASQPATTTVDGTPPPAPVLNASSGSPITGTAEPGSVVTVKDDAGNLIGSTTTGTNGVYSITPAKLPAHGVKISAVATDAAGNASQPGTTTIDSLAPAKPTIDATNGNLITGTAEPQSVVTIRDGAGNVVGSTAADTNGAYSIKPSTIPAHNTVLRATAADAAGNTSPEARATVDSELPSAPKIDPTNGSRITGMAEAGSVVTIKDGLGNVVGNATADANGAYSIAPTTPPANGAVLSVTATDAAGNTSQPASTTVDAKAPDAPTVSPTNGGTISGTAEPGSVVTIKDGAGKLIGSTAVEPNGTYIVTPVGTLANGTAVNVVATDTAGNTSQAASATVDSVPPARPTIDATNGVLITGTAELKSVVTIRDGAGNAIGSATADANSVYSVKPATVLAHNTVLRATATDAAGNTGSEARATVDGELPSAPKVDPTKGSLITGTAEAGSVVTVKDGANNVIGSATAAANGAYSIAPATTPAHGEVLSVTATDAAGNTSQPASATVDSKAPGAPAVNPTNGSTVTGTAEAGAVVTVRDGAGKVIGSATAASGGNFAVDIATPPAHGTQIQVIATDAAGNASQPATTTVDSVPPPAPTLDPTNGNLITGTAESDSIVTVRDGAGNVVGNTKADANGAYSLKPTTVAANDTVLRAVATDAAGNASPEARTMVDSVVPTAPTVNPTNGSRIAGKAEAGSVVTVKDDAGALIGSATADANGAYSITPAAAPAHGTVLHAVATDAAGNTSPETTARIDRSALATPTISPTDGNPITGTAEHGSVVTVKDDAGNLIGSTTADAGGAYSLTPDATLAHGTVLHVVATNAAGTNSPEATAKVDSQAPNAPRVEPTNGNLITGTAEAGAVVRVTDDSDRLIGSAIAAPNGTYSIKPAAIPAHGTVLRAVATDAAGNASPEARETVDRVLPPAPTIAPTAGNSIAGTAEAGSVVTVKDSAGNLIGSATAAASGAYSIAPAATLPNGTVLRAVATDAAGNASPEARATVDGEAPVTPTVDATNGNQITGTAEPGSLVTVKDGAGNVIGSATTAANGSYAVKPAGKPADGTLLSVAATDAAGNVSQPATARVDGVAPDAPTVNPANGSSITGKAEPGSVVTVKDGAGKVIGSATAAADGTYTVNPAKPPEDGATIKVAATDKAGNASPEVTATVDGLPPARPTVNPTNGNLITGTAEPGSVVTVKDGAGNLIGSTTAGVNGSYAVKPANTPANGTTLNVAATDAAGNIGPATTARVDSVPPAAPIANPTNGDPITGTAEAGALVTVFDDAGTAIGSAIAASDGKYSIKPTARPADGAQLRIVATDPAGNASQPASATVDGKAPDAPKLNPTNGSSVTGTAEAGSVVTVKDGSDKVIGSATVGADGTYAINPARPPEDGTTLKAVAIDTAGNGSPEATVTVDNMPPAKPSVNPTNGKLIAGTAEANSVVTVKDDSGKVVGSATAAADGSYSIKPASTPAHGAVLHATAIDAAGNTSPEVKATVDSAAPATATVKPTNGDTITGSAEPGSVVTVKDKAGSLVGSATTDANGVYTVKPTTRPAHGTVLEVTAADAAGNASSPASATVDSKAPEAPTIAPNHGNPITGTAESGSTVTISDGTGKVIGSATAASDGSYSITPAKPPEDGAKISAVAADAAGNVSAATTATVDAVPPQRPTVYPTNGSTITGKAEPGSIVTVADQTGKAIGSVTADAGGNYAVKPTTPPAHGATLGVSATDAAGNTGPAATATVDSAAPAMPTVKPTSGGIIAGTAEAGSVVTVKDSAGNLVGSAAADASGNYTVKPATAPKHDTVLEVAATDAAGNTGPSARTTVDSKAPDTPTIKPTSGSTIAGTAEAGSVVTVRDSAGNLIGSATAGSNGEYRIAPATPAVNGTQLRVVATDAAGNASQPGTAVVDSVAPVIAIAIVNDANNDGFINAKEKGADVTARVTLVSGADVGDEISVTDGTRMYDVKLAAADVAKGFVDFSFPNPAEGSPIRVSAISKDVAGNVSRPTANDSAVLDTTAPATPATVSATDNFGTVQGAFGNGGSTDDTTPTFAGSGATPGEVVKVYDGAALLGSTTVKSDGSWELTPAGLVPGTHSITHTITDAAGNTSAASAPLGFTVDTGAVAVSVTKAGETRQGQQIKTRPTGSTDDTTPTIVGTATPGAVVTIKEGAAVLASTAADASGNWNLMLPAQAEGAHSYKATAVNAAGNSSETAFTLTIDTTPPAVPVIAAVGDDVGTVQGPLSSGAATDDTRPTLGGSGATPGDIITIHDNGSAIGSTTVQSDGRWSFTTAAPTAQLAEGEHKLTATATDPVGNRSQHSAPFVINVDTTPPARPDAVSSYVDSTGATQDPASVASSTDDTTPGFRIASVAAGQTPSLYVDGAKVAATYDPNTGTLTPTFPLGEGAHTVSYTLTDAAGNESPRANDFRLTVDTTPPPALDASLIQVLDDVGAMTGPLAAGAQTDDSKPEYAGKADPNQVASVNVYDNGMLIGGAAVRADGSWRFTPGQPLAQGPHSFTARPVDAAGNIGASTLASTFTLLGDAPPAPAITGVSDDKGSLAKDASTNDTTLTLGGTAKADTVVTVYANDVAVGSTSVATNGTWSVTTSPLSGDGVKNLRAVAVDGAGQASPSTGLYPVMLDTTAPATPAVVVVTDGQGLLKGPIAAGGTTDDASPTFSGNGLKAGDTVKVYDGDTLIASLTAANDGAWSMTPGKPLGEGAHSIKHTITDAAGNTSAASAPLAFTVDTSDVVVSIGHAEDNQGSIKTDLASGSRTDDITPTLVGKTTAGALVTVTDGANGPVLGSTTADAGGNWRLVLPAQNEGRHEYKATAVNAAGKKGEAAIELTIDTTAPGSPKITGVGDDVGLVQGPLANGGFTDDTTPTLGGSGATAGDVIKVYDNGSFLGSTTVKADGSWSFTPTTPLTEGAHKLITTATDPVGNESPQSGVFTVNVDVTPPTAKATLVAISTDTGTSASDFVTSDRTLVATVTVDAALEPGATVELSLDNGKTWNKATPVGGSKYQFDNTAASLPDGSHTFLARVVDVAGNAGQPTSQVMVIDNSSPTAGNAVAVTAYTDDVAPNTGDYGSGTSTNDTTPVLKGTVSGLKAGNVVQILEGTALLGTATVNGNAWTFALPALASGSTHTYKAVIANAAGNKGTASADFSLTVNTETPIQSATILSFIDDQNPQQGTFASGSTTNDTSPLLNGTLTGPLNAGSAVVIYRNGQRLGAAALTGDSTWTFQDAGLVDGTSYSYVARVEDAAGNRGGASASFTLTVDQRAPTAAPSIESAFDDVAPVTGSIAAGGTTNDARPELKGSGAEPNGIVRIYDNGTLIGTATVDSAGKWSFTPEAGRELANGAHSLTTSSVDAAGNEGPRSAPLAFTVDTIAPSQSTTIVSINDDQGSLRGKVADGGYTDDAAPQVAGTISAALQAGEKVVVLRDGAVIGTATMTDATSWTFDDAGLSDGRTYSYTARVEDAGGNRGAISGGYAVTIDTSVPMQKATISTVFDNADPVQGDVANGGTTNDSQPELRGTVTGGLGGNEVVAVYRDNVRIGTATVLGTSWSYTDTSGLANAASYSYTARVEDAAGNGGAASSPYVITLKLSGPPTTTTITAVTDDVDPQQGPVANDGYTNDTTPKVTGTVSAALQAGEKVIVLRDGKEIGSATMTDATHWTYADSGLSNGRSYVYTARVQDAASNPGAESNAHTIRIDTTAPTQTVKLVRAIDNVDPVSGDIPANGHTNDDTPTLEGTISAALGGTEQLHVFRNGLHAGIAKVTGTAWTFEDASLSSGTTYTYEARVMDSAGNAGAASNSLSFTVNTSGVSQTVQILRVLDDTEPAKGNLVNGGMTNETRPLLSGSISTALNAGDVVEVLRNDKVIGTATVTGTAWYLQDTGLADGMTYNYTARVVNSAGNQGAQSAAHAITVDLKAPTQSVAITSYTDNQDPTQGTFGSGSTTNDATPQLNGTLDGTLDAGEMVAIYRNGVRLGAATMTGASAWTFQDSGLVDGTRYSYTARVEDAAGNQGGSSAVFTLAVDRTAPATAPSVDSVTDNTSPVTGPITSGGATNDTRPQLKGSGAEPNGMVRIYDNGTLIGTATVDSAGKWSFTPEAGKELAEGAHRLTASSVDTAGNEGPQSKTLDFTVDTNAPTQSTVVTAVNDNLDPQQGTVANNGYTNDLAPQVEGTISAALQGGEKVAVLRDGVVVGTATMTDATHWTFDDAGLADATSYRYTARVEDAAGNRGALSNRYTITVDASAPAPELQVTISTVFDNVDPGQGNIANGGTTNDSQPELRGTLSAGLGSNEVVAVYRDGVKIGRASVSGTGWFFIDDTGLVNATRYSYTARVEDAAGNAGVASSPYAITLQATGPTTIAVVTAVIDDVDPQQGTVADNGYTNDTAPMLTGTISAALRSGEKVVLLRNGMVAGTATMTDATHWTYADSGLATGTTYAYVAHVQDAASNPGPYSSAYTVRIDTTAPTQTVVLTRAIDNVDPVSGDIAANGSTNDDSPTLEGRLSSALNGTEQLYVFRNGVNVGIAKVSGRAWTFDDAGLASGSTYTYEARVMDAAGNAGAASNSLSFTVNTSAVSQAVQILQVQDDRDPVQGNVANGGATNDATPTLGGSISTALNAGDVVQVLRDGTVVGTATVTGTAWSFRDTGLADGMTYSYTARVVNSSGNQGAQSTAYAIKLDQDAPTQTATITSYTDNQNPLQGTFESGSTTNDAAPQLNGTVEGTLGAGEVVAIYRDGVRLGAATMTGASAWTFQDSGLVDGTRYRYVARVEDAAGNRGSASAAFTLSIDQGAPTAAPSIDSVTDNTAPATGAITPGGATNDTRPALTGSGAEPNSTVRIYDNGTLIGTATAGGAGKWSFTPATGSELANGTHSLAVSSVDAAGNEGPKSSPLNFTVDTVAPSTAPSVESVMDETAPVTGPITSGSSTNETRPVLKGTGAEPNGTVRIYDNGTLIGTATADGAGKWSFTPEAGKELANGAHRLTTSSVDAAGNEGPKSSPLNFTVDTVAPSQLATITAISADTGLSTTDFITSDTTLVVTATVNAAIGAGEKVQISLDDGATWKDANLVSGSTYQLDNTGVALAPGEHAFMARVIDAAGNTGSPSKQRVVIDTQSSSGVSIGIASITTDTGVAGDFITNDTSLTINGTLAGKLAADEVAQISADGSSWTNLTVANGSWSYVDGRVLTEGRHDYRVRVVDTAGNLAASASQAVLIDITAPTTGNAVAITAYTDDVAPNTGDYASGTSTNDTTPVLKGTVSGLNAGDVVKIYEGSTFIGDATVLNGTWTLQLNGVGKGSHEYRAVITDASGNAGTASAPFSLTVSLALPSISVSIDSISEDNGVSSTDFITTDNTLTVNGTLSRTLGSNETVQIRLDNGTWVNAATTGTAWSYSGGPVLSEGQHTYQVRVVDAAGNIGAEQTKAVTIDVTPPAGSITVNALSTADTTPTITGTVSGLAAGDSVWVTCNGVTYKQGIDAALKVTGSTWSLSIPQANRINWNGSSDLVVNVDARIVDVAGNGNGAASSPGVVIYRDATVIRSQSFDYMAEVQPSLIGRGKIGAGEKLIVEVADSTGKVVKTFSSASDVTMDANLGGWKIAPSAWGSTQLGSGSYTVKAYVNVADGSGGQVSEVETFRIVKPVINDAVSSYGDDAASKAYALSDGSYWLFYVSAKGARATQMYADYDLFAQKFSQQGAKIGGQVTISATSNATDGYSTNDLLQYIKSYDVAFKADGSFNVFYSSNNSMVPHIKRFNSSGTAIGSTENIRNPYSYEVEPTYVAMPDGRYALLYASGTIHNYNIYQMRFRADGAEIDTNPVALTTGTNWMNGFAQNVRNLGAPTGDQTGVCTQGLAAVAIDNDRYAMLYMSNRGNNASYSSKTDMFVRVYDFSTGRMVGSEVPANTNFIGYQVGAQVVSLKEGGFVTVWASNHTANSVNGTMDEFNVYARRFAWNNSSQSITASDPEEVRVNTTTSGVNGVGFDGMSVQLGAAALAHGGYVVVWNKATSPSTSEVYGQTFDAAGNKLGGETQISAGGWSNDLEPAVTALPDGGYVVSWTKSLAPDYWGYRGGSTYGFQGDIKTIIVNADGSIRGAGDTQSYPVTASYIDGSGTLNGNDAVNTLDGRKGASVLNAGGGNDYIIIKDTSFTSVDGGAGNDTLIWDSTKNLNFSDIAAKVKNIETIHLGDKNANILKLTLADVLGASGTTDTLLVQGGRSDQVVIEDTWSLAAKQEWRGETYNVYTNRLDSAASLWVQDGIAVNPQASQQGETRIAQMSMTGANATAWTYDIGDQFEGRSGNDVFKLVGGGSDTVLYKLLASSDATGGNGFDSVNGFTVGAFEATPDADRIDLRELLVGYKADAGDNIANYLSVTVSNGNTTLSIDRDGSGTAYSETPLVTLNGVTTDLATLLANHQLVLV
ncbi:Ig-like domain-containing protein [Variovorax gossypii]